MNTKEYLTEYSEEYLQKILQQTLARGGDYADIFIESTRDNRISFDAGKVKTISGGTIAGVGLRVIYGTSYVYVYAGNPDEQKILTLAEQIAEAVNAGAHGFVTPLTALPARQLSPIRVEPSTVAVGNKVEMLYRADSAARDYSDKIKEVQVSYWDNDQSVLIASSDGKFVRDRRIRTRMSVVSIAEDGDKKETGFFGPGKTRGFEFFDYFKPEDIAAESARIACVLLDADYAPQGKLPVIIDNAFGGVIFHEACGHALEATSVADNASVFSGKLGETIASPIVNAVDDGTLANEWGTNSYDDEGNETRRNRLIENGVLKSYMIDKLGSIKMGLPVTGSSRRESYQFAPTSRMTNTFILPGESTLEEMIGSVENGLFCSKMGGGSVNPPTTDFNFSCSEAYLIRNGKIDRPVKGASLIGKGSEIIKNIEMIGQNLDHGTGMCGSFSGSIPANVGQPAIKVSGLVIGGRS